MMMNADDVVVMMVVVVVVTSQAGFEKICFGRESFNWRRGE